MPSFSFHVAPQPAHIFYFEESSHDGPFVFRRSGYFGAWFGVTGVPGTLPRSFRSAAVSTSAAESRVVGSIPAILFGIHIGTLTDEKFHDVIPSPEGGAMKRSHPAVIFGLDVTSGLQQQIQRGDCPLFDIFSDVPSP